MKFTAAILATASAANSGIAGDLVAADSHFWSNAGAISQNADSILKSPWWDGKFDKAMDDAFHMCTTGSHVDLDIIWECGKKVTAATFDKNPSFNLMGRYAASQFHQLDQDGDGQLNFDEFKRGFAGFFSTVGSTLVDIYDADGNGRLEGQENHDMHLGLNNIWDEFSSDKNRELITPILDTWVGSDLDKNVDTLSKAEMTEQAILHSVPYW
ncbi:Oidioi.mRNA.OKI2018_I69.chr2.g4723.t1.cds [Oikopleura dioica]|uniref:Oidioi.mRNA.OKI2018_I69.chr2.g4723.t1.cds n=1 Tax=Oikopleura dioica TaxID=34765 RepID=A0ABN7T3V1_OIKDI|nr:Oidioi.mRNA.OKI2018_I69.chr2.g4723.t1.cds [Oikopleura dioica]